MLNSGFSYSLARRCISPSPAETRGAGGVPAPELYDAVRRVDPTHARARAQRSVVAQDEVLHSRRRRRTLGALGLLGVAMATLWLLMRRPARRMPRVGAATG